MLSRTATRLPNFLRSRLIYTHCSIILSTEKSTSLSGVDFKGNCRFQSRNTNAELGSSANLPGHYKKKDTFHIGTIEDLQSFVSHPSTTVNDILQIDVRQLPSDACMLCLEAVLRLHKQSNKEDSLIQHAQNNLRASVTSSSSDWPLHYINLEHITRWHKFNLGINPFNDNDDHADAINKRDCTAWINSEKFDLLLLTTTACANRLDLRSLLNLAGHFRYFWDKYEPKAYASILRQIHNQINELSIVQMAQIAHILSNIQCDQTNRLNRPLMNEIKSFQSAIIIHLLHKTDLLTTTTHDPTLIIRLIYDLRWSLTKNQLWTLFDSVYHSLLLNKLHWNLYTIAYLLLHMSKLEVCRPSLIKNCLNKISRKLRISEYHVAVNQCQWMNAMLSALANSTISFYSFEKNSNEVEELQGFIQPPFIDPSCKNNNDRILHENLFDMHKIFTADWVQELFTAILQHAATQPILDYNSLKCLAQLIYSLSLFGYKADLLIEQYNDAEKQLNNSTTTTTSVCTQPPFINMAKCLTTPLSKTSSEEEKSSVLWIPRSDWRFYYLCGLGLIESNTINDPLLSVYISLKQRNIDKLCRKFYEVREELRNFTLLPFQFIQFPNNNSCDNNNSSTINKSTYFADILFKTRPNKYTGNSRYAICIVHQERDIIVKGSLLSLVNFYYQTQRLPVLMFNYTTYQSLDKQGKEIMLRNFLNDIYNGINDNNELSSTEILTFSCILHNKDNDN
ncbi:unnamed protein product [Trichobilharzia szidati]|nr:unnamed protein product [Trichobilharzia szidati]